MKVTVNSGFFCGRRAADKFGQEHVKVLDFPCFEPESVDALLSSHKGHTCKAGIFQHDIYNDTWHHRHDEPHTKRLTAHAATSLK